MTTLTRLLSLASVVAATWCSAPLAFAQEETTDAKLKQITSEWEQRRLKTKSVHYELAGKVLIPKGSYNYDLGIPRGDGRQFPKADYQFDKKITLTMDFEKNWLRYEVRDEKFHGQLLTFQKNYLIRTFDGSRFKGFRPRGENEGMSEGGRELTLGSTNLAGYNGPQFDWDEFPMFFAHGIFTTTPNARDGLRKSIDPKSLRLVGEAVQANERRLVLKTIPSQSGESDEIWVDPAHSAVITRWINHRPDRIAAQLEIAYQQTPESWLPHNWTLTDYQRRDQIYATYNYHVVAVTLNVPLQRSDLALEREVKPGMVVEDLNQGERVYIVKSDGTFTPLQLGPEGSLSEGRWGWFWFALWVGLGIVVLGGGIWLARKRLSRGWGAA